MKIDSVTQKMDSVSYEQQNIELVAQTEQKVMSVNVEKQETNNERIKKEDIEKSVEKLNQAARIFNKRFHFSIHEATKRVMVQVIDTNTDKVINEIPPKKVLDIISSVSNILGLMVDEKA